MNISGSLQLVSHTICDIVWYCTLATKQMQMIFSLNGPTLVHVVGEILGSFCNLSRSVENIMTGSVVVSE